MIKAYELMAMIAKEPKKYEGKRYKITEGPANHFIDGDFTIVEVFRDYSTKNGMTLVGVKNDATTRSLVSISTRTLVEEIQQSVPVAEALKAYNDDFKTIRVHIDGYSDKVYKVSPQKCSYGTALRSMCGHIISAKEILEGTWYIEG